MTLTRTVATVGEIKAMASQVAGEFVRHGKHAEAQGVYTFAERLVAYVETGRVIPPCPCECNHGGFCGGCGHAGCGGRR